jgi:hypothetical protein
MSLKKPASRLVPEQPPVLERVPLVQVPLVQVPLEQVPLERVVLLQVVLRSATLVPQNLWLADLPEEAPAVPQEIPPAQSCLDYERHMQPPPKQ